MSFDPIGLSVGVIGLAGLVSTTIELFSIFRGMRAFGRDQEILCTKLDIEKALLIQWAQQVGLLKRNLIDGRLFSPRTDALIYSVLKEIVALLKDGEKLQRRYGLQRVVAGDADFRTDAVSRHRMKELGWRDQRDVRYGSVSNRKDVGVVKKFSWTIHDKAEFQELINELGYFVGKLYQMIPSVEQRKMMCEDLRKVGADMHTLRLVEAAADGVHDDWSDVASRLADETETVLSGRGQQHGEKKKRKRVSPVYEGQRPHSSASTRSSGSGRSGRSGNTLVDMAFDLLGGGPQPRSDFRY